MTTSSTTAVLPRGTLSLANFAASTQFHHPLLKADSVLCLMPRNAGAGNAYAVGLYVSAVSAGGCTIMHPYATSAVRQLAYYIL